MKKKAVSYVYYHIKPFKDNDLGINHRNSLLQNLSSIKDKKITFAITGNSNDIKLYAKVPIEYQNYFRNTFYSNFPTSDLIRIQNPSRVQFIQLPKPTEHHIKEYIHFPRKSIMISQQSFTKDGKYMDPMKDIFAIYNNVDNSSMLTIFFVTKFSKSKSLWEHIKKAIKFIFQRKSKEPEDELEKQKAQDKSRKEIYLAIGYQIKTNDSHCITNIKKVLPVVFSAFTHSKGAKSKTRPQLKDMNIDQASNFFHIPTVDYFIKGLNYTLYRKLPYPTNIPTISNNDDNIITILGKSDYRGESVEFGIKKEDKFRHMYIVGKTGTGKSTLISNMIKSDMISGNGLCLLDPHGDLVDTVVQHIPKNRINDVILFDISDTDYPIGFNLLQYDNEDEKNRIVSGVVSTFYKLFEHSRGPRLEYILRNVLLSVVEYPNATLMHILRVLVDKDFRTEVLSHVQDDMVLRFWNNEFNKWNDKQREEAIGPITNKIGQFLSSSIVRNIFGQPRTKLNIRKSMDEGKIILVNLSKGKIGEDNAAMIGSLLVTKIQIDAMSRADIPFEQRRDFYFYIDEFQNFATQSFATILSEARKYKLSLIVANQYTSQLMEPIRDAIFGNVGTTISFALGHDDAKIMTGQYKELISTNDLLSLPRFHAYIKLMVNGISSDPFSMKTMPLTSPIGQAELLDKIKKQSRQRYAMPREELEKLLEAWNKKTFSIQEKITEKSRLEGLGATEQELKNLQDPFVQAHTYLFQDYKIDDIEPDAIIFDTKNSYHKVIFYIEPQNLHKYSIQKVKIGTRIPKKNGTFIPIHVDIYQHKQRTNPQNKAIMIWVADKQSILQQLTDGYPNNSHLLFCPNVDKLHKTDNLDQTISTTKSNKKEANNKTKFDIKDIKIGEWYDGYVKLKYNYGMFITVKGVEGLLHKNFIVAPNTDISWKQYYNIGDKIRVKATGFKEVKGDKRVVRSQK